VSVRRLGPPELPAVVDLCRRSIADAPTPTEIEAALVAPEQPSVIFGDPATGVVAAVECDDGAHIRLLVVDPAARGAGMGHALLGAAEDWARAQGLPRIVTGADPPYFLWPGVPRTETALLCLLERRHYARGESNFNMRIHLDAVPPDPGGHRMAARNDRTAVDAWAGMHWPNWRLEILRALDKGNLVLAHDDAADGDIVAFCAFEVNRSGLLGPVGVRPDLIGQGRGKGVLLGALHELHRRGAREIDVVWVGPVPPYAAVGGRVGDVFFVYRKELS